jgi:thiol-disulfide isomerase/thioredoxin
MRKLIVAVGLGLICAATAMAQPRQSTIANASRYACTLAARAAVKAGDRAQFLGRIGRANSDYKRAISRDPNCAEAQKKYFFTYVWSNSREIPKGIAKEERLKAFKRSRAIANNLIAEYKSLASQNPDSPVYPWVMGEWLVGDQTNMARSKSYCRQAVSIDEHFAQGWACLSHIALLRGNDEKASSYLRQAMKILPHDENIAFRYASRLAFVGENHGKESRALVRRFPKSLKIMVALVDSANKLKRRASRIAALEKLRKSRLVLRKAASWAARYLYRIYLTEDLRKAKELSHEMIGPHSKNKRWVDREAFVDGLMRVQHELDAGQGQSALVSLNAIRGDIGEAGLNVVAWNQWYLTKAEALDTRGRTKDAVATLRSRFIAFPSDAVLASMVRYGKKMGQSRGAVYDALWSELRAKAKPAHPFTLRRLDSHQLRSLSDYHGKVVIADFWFPGCEGCLLSFPYLNNVATRFQHSGLSVLAINAFDNQQPRAASDLQRMGYSFIGLAGNRKLSEQAYEVRGYPSTFFIGPRGNVLFKIHVWDVATRRSADAAVKFMLTQADSRENNHKRH